MGAALAFRGTLVDTPSYGELSIRPDQLLVVGEDGRIAKVAPGEQEQAVLAEFKVPEERVRRLKVNLKTWTSLHTGWLAGYSS
jgi:hypothetical protein